MLQVKEDYKGNGQDHTQKKPAVVTIGESLGSASLEESLCISGVLYIQARAEPVGYN